MKRYFILLLIFVMANNAFARLGETKAQLIERFGKPYVEFEQRHSKHGFTYAVGNIVAFQKDDWKIECLLISNQCAQVIYRKPGSWTDEQFKQLLFGNSGTNNWQEVVPKSPNKLFHTWKRSDGAMAQYDFVNGVKFSSPAYFAEIKRIEETALQRSKKVPNF
jgi:ABC-type phosphate transport system substrate-binding protein